MLSSLQIKTLSAQKVVLKRSLSSYGQQRTQFKKQLTALRKDWTTSNKPKSVKSEEVKSAEKQKLILQQAIKLREHKAQSEIRQAAHKKIAEDALVKYKERLARTQMVAAERLAAQQKRYELAVADLEEEKHHWITMDNIDTKITTKLFDGPATTGLTNKYSDFWRVHCFQVDIKRLIEMSRNPRTAVEFRKQLRAENEMDKRYQVASYLNTIVGNGKDREQFSEMVEEFTQIWQDRGDFREDDAALEQEFAKMELPKRKFRNYKYENIEYDSLEPLSDIDRKNQHSSKPGFKHNRNKDKD